MFFSMQEKSIFTFTNTCAVTSVIYWNCNRFSVIFRDSFWICRHSNACVGQLCQWTFKVIILHCWRLNSLLNAEGFPILSCNLHSEELLLCCDSAIVLCRVALPREHVQPFMSHSSSSLRFNSHHISFMPCFTVSTRCISYQRDSHFAQTPASSGRAIERWLGECDCFERLSSSSFTTSRCRLCDDFERECRLSSTRSSRPL